ncbi:crotonase/enoyl-CoA hydratase family protein [Aeromonas salmonicida]|uniref:crotonase/enoyl-CoA hydratase family protein n=1 Tax=Aeromonas salmonicida TaxID=645 RepID=UPI00259DBF71|nr:crotonase/enoyl-CoA hydratase family protein [Aeromonas salmonicida]MDM5127180.1 crotonase/enoyl-CoA hydratase family protein [Aeromonas salmonicida]
MEKPRVKCEVRDGIAEVMLARGDKLNALDRSMFGAIDQTLAELQQHKGLRAVILYGEGRAFCAGLDVKSMLKQPVAALDILKREADEATNLAQRVAYGWHQLPVPVIAVTQGVCFGGGLQIALGADFRFSTPDCRFSVMEIKWGIIPDMSGCVTLRNLMGVDTAMELAMSGRECDALEAKSLGLVSRVCEDPLTEAREFARTLITKSPDALAGIKQLYQQAWARSDEVMLKEETRLQKQILGRPNQWRATFNSLFRWRLPFGPRRNAL